jgi:hypothetical protein
VDTEFDAARQYGNWFWGFSPGSVRAMLRATGWHLLDFYEYRWVVTAVCRPEPDPTPSYITKH